MNNRTIKNKIGYVDNRYLGIDKPSGHYVYIRKVNKDGTCDVNVFTSLEKNGQFRDNKIKHIKYGLVYPIPKNDSNFSRWTGCTNNSIKNVDTSKIQNIGEKKIKKRHHFFIGKYMK